jgi:hypothetical protein
MFRIVVGLYLVWVAALALSIGCQSMRKSKTASLRPAPIKIEPAPLLARAKGNERVDRDLQPATALEPTTSLPKPRPAMAEDDSFPDLAKAVPSNPETPTHEESLPPASRPQSPTGPDQPMPLPLSPTSLPLNDPMPIATPTTADSPMPIREAPDAPSAKDPPSKLDRADEICRRAEEFNAKHPDFVCRMTRSERIQGSIRNPELMLMKLRGEPRSVHLKWLDSPNEGRECIYVAGANNGKMISRGGKGDLLLAGRTLWLDPDGSLAKSKSSQTITETGLDVISTKIRRRVDLLKRGNPSEGTLSASTGPDPFIPVLSYDWIEHLSPPGVDSDLKSGGTHLYGFRQDTGQLEVVHAFNKRGDLMYTYRFERLIPVTRWEENDFNAESLRQNRSKDDPTEPEERVVQKNDNPPQ